MSFTVFLLVFCDLPSFVSTSLPFFIKKKKKKEKKEKKVIIQLMIFH